jgi:hypothetical protein
MQLPALSYIRLRIFSKMKQRCFFLFLLLLSGTAVYGQETDSVKTFDAAALSPEQRSYCMKFRHAEKNSRLDIFQKIESIFPSAQWELLDAHNAEMNPASISFRMTRSQLEDLLGPPDNEGNLLLYHLGPDYCAVNFGVLEDQSVYLAGYVNCRF